MPRRASARDAAAMAPVSATCVVSDREPGAPDEVGRQCFTATGSKTSSTNVRAQASFPEGKKRRANASLRVAADMDRAQPTDITAFGGLWRAGAPTLGLPTAPIPSVNSLCALSRSGVVRHPGHLCGQSNRGRLQALPCLDRLATGTAGASRSVNLALTVLNARAGCLHRAMAHRRSVVTEQVVYSNDQGAAPFTVVPQVGPVSLRQHVSNGFVHDACPRPC